VTDAYRHRTTLQVRFRDIDAFKHVNNAVFFSYVEQARIRYLLDVLEPDRPFDRLPLILARGCRLSLPSRFH
jgi:acyl-CoA thioester hydrolase